jgi:anti-sigma factor ChrR (cupin superfamily)
MSNPLRSAISDLAATFAASIVTAIRSSNLEDILALSGTAATAPSRRGPGRASKARGGAATGSPRAQLADGGWGSSGRTGRAAGGGGLPDPLVVSAKAKKTATVPATKAAATAKKGRLARRTPAEIAKALEQVVALLKGSKGGLRSEQIRAQLKMDKKELPRVLKEGLAKKVLKSKGEKRSTTYSVA